MYVAATRARRDAVAVRRAAAGGATGSSQPAAHSLLELLWPVLAERFELPEAARRRRAAARSRTARCGACDAGWQPAAAAGGRRCCRTCRCGQLALEPPEFSWVGETQRHIGTLVHGWLARLASGRAAGRREAIGAQRAAVLAQLRPRTACRPRERAAAAALILAALDAARSPMSAAAGSSIPRTATRTASWRSRA